jgi:hypothetical protein
MLFNDKLKTLKSDSRVTVWAEYQESITRQAPLCHLCLAHRLLGFYHQTKAKVVHIAQQL